MTRTEKEPLKALERILKRYRQVLSEAVETIREQDVSNYPIFVASQNEIEVGIPFLLKGQVPEGWLINASTLEEFHVKRIIGEDKMDDFRRLYRSRADDLCIFAYLPAEITDSTEPEPIQSVGGVAKFIFVPKI